MNTVSCPVDGVGKVTMYLSCKKCNAAFPLTADQKILHGANCRCAQLKDKSPKCTIAKALFTKNEAHISLTIFDGKLVTLHNMYKPDAKVADSNDLNEDDVTEFLLSVEVIVFYNKKFNIT